MLLVLVVHRLFLDLAALVAGLHRAQNPAALGDRLELLQHRFFDEVGELVDDERALVRVLVLRQAPLAVDDELDRHRAAHRFLGRRGDGLVVGIRMQAVGVVVGRDQRLQRGADVVERDLLRVQAAKDFGVTDELACDQFASDPEYSQKKSPPRLREA